MLTPLKRTERVRNWPQLFEKIITDKDFKLVVRTLIEAAKDGDMRAQKLLLDKLLPAHLKVDQTIDVLHSLPESIEALLCDSRRLDYELTLDATHLPCALPEAPDGI
jgi:hypothetical protein